MLCLGCNAGLCRAEKDKDFAVEIECPLCDGGGCIECREGWYEVKQCPQLYCGEVSTAIDLFELFKAGTPPVHGGVLDQSFSFVKAARRFENEEIKVANEQRSHRNPDYR